MKINSLCVIAGICLAITGLVNADIIWQNDSTRLITDHDGSALTSSSDDPTVGCFAQLIKASGSTASAFDAGNAYGVSGGDTVVDNNYTRQGSGIPLNGYFPAQTYALGSDAGYYYVRVFNAAADSSAAYDAMTLPSEATYYFESTVFSYGGGEPPPSSTFYFASGLSGDQLRTSNPITAVPEPTTLAFLGLGVVAFVVRKRVRS